jgi:hypothetical protein
MRMGTLVMAAALLLGAFGMTFAGAVNCKQVNKYLQTGRSVKDVAETMVVDEADVKRCQAEASEGTGAAKEGGEKPADPDAQKEMK